MWHFVTSNLPSLGAIFYSTVLGAITIVILGGWRKVSSRAWDRFLSDEKADKLINRLERNMIIRRHVQAGHEAKLQNCIDDHCYKLTPKAARDSLEVVLAGEAGLDLTHQ
jgi:hypothetical protein